MDAFQALNAESGSPAVSLVCLDMVQVIPRTKIFLAHLRLLIAIHNTLTALDLEVTHFNRASSIRASIHVPLPFDPV